MPARGAAGGLSRGGGAKRTPKKGAEPQAAGVVEAACSSVHDATLSESRGHQGTGGGQIDTGVTRGAAQAGSEGSVPSRSIIRE